MRKNIVPHFLNRDSREIIGFEKIAGDTAGIRFLSDALRAAVLLSETAAILPPGHFLESDVAYEVITQNRGLLSTGMIEMPMRETNLLDLIEKKRIEYGSVRHQFPGLFDDERMRLFEDITPFFKQRTTRIGYQATMNWEKGPDENQEWEVLKSALSLDTTDLLRSAPKKLLKDGEALTWPALLPHLTAEVLESSVPVRVVLHKNYFKLYLDEYRAALLSDLPYGFDVYISEDDERHYSYRGLARVLRALRCRRILRLPVEALVRLKESEGWTAFADAFVQLQAWADTPTNVVSAFSRAANDVGFTGLALQAATADGLSGLRILSAVDEVAEGLAFLSARLSSEYSLVVRTAVRPTGGSPITRSTFRPEGNTQVMRASPTGGQRRTMRRVLIATSNQRETSGVLDALAEIVGPKKHDIIPDKVPRYSFNLPAKKKRQVTVDLVLADDTGGNEAVQLLRSYMSEKTPDAVFFVGCLGLLDEKHLDEKHELEENTVFVAKRAFDADKRKLTDEGTKYDSDLQHGDRWLRSVIEMLDSKKAFAPIRVVTRRDFISSGAFHESRISKERSDLVERFPPDAVGLGMEAYAVYKERARMLEEGVNVRVLVVKGISDLGDEQAQEGKKKKQRRAAANAAKVVLTLLQEVGG